MMDYQCRISSNSTVTSTSPTESTSTTPPSSNTSPRSPTEKSARSELKSEQMSTSNDLLLALTLLKQSERESRKEENRMTPNLGTLQKLLLAQLGNPSENKATLLKPGPIWNGLGLSSVQAATQIKPLMPFIDPVNSHVQPNAKDKAGHGRRGRPLGSVGRRKLLENNQESLKSELRRELIKIATPERDARIDMIRRKIQENDMRLRRLNEAKTGSSRVSVGEKRDRSQLSPSSTVNIAPKPVDLFRNFPTIVPSPCKQQKLEETKIEPVMNTMMNSVCQLSSNITSAAAGMMSLSEIKQSQATALNSTPVVSADQLTTASMLPRLSPLTTLQSPPRTLNTPSTQHISPSNLVTQSSALLTPPMSMVTPPMSMVTPPISMVTPPLLTHPLITPPSSLLTPPPYTSSSDTNRAIVDHLLASISTQSLPLEAAVALHSLQKTLESQPMDRKCTVCNMNFTPNMELGNCFNKYLCSACALRIKISSLIRLPGME